MLFSNYPNGFDPRALIKELFDVEVLVRQCLWVGNNTVKITREIAAADANKGTYLAPYSTIDAANNATGGGSSTDGAYDVIFVRPGHTLSIADATTLVLDKDNVIIIGLGHMDNLPTLTFTTDTAAAIPVTGDNVMIDGLYLKCNIASQVTMVDVAGKGFVWGKRNRCAEGSATGLNFITIGTADNDSDNFRILGGQFYAPTAGNYDSAISIAKDMANGYIGPVNIYGDFDNAGIDIPAGGNAQVNLILDNCNATNTQTGQHAVQINGTGNTGRIIKGTYIGDTTGTIVDAGGLDMFDVKEHDGTDQVNAQIVGGVIANPTLLDDSNNPIGVNDADNSFSSSSVVENADGSVLERLEYIQAGIPRSVENSSVDLTSGDVVDVFTVSGGPVLVHMLAVEITSAVSANASLLHFEADPTTGASNTPISKSACAPDIASAAAGDWFAVAGGSTVDMVKYANGTALPPVVSSAASGIVVPIGGIDLKLSTSDPTTGVGNVYIVYTPMAPGAKVA
ncbi:MAG: hypothetical protein ACFFD1_00125 [Candidatus Thorarchaeota archaeon]